jgi:5-methylcytosine-specific restriction endonuclease McrA
MEKSVQPKEVAPSTMQCKDCGKINPFTEGYFHKDPTMRYGLIHTCKVCVYAKQTQDRKAHPENYARRVREWRIKNIEHALQRERKWQEANRERRRQQERDRRAANPEPFKASQRRYRQTEQGKMASRIGCHRRRARIKRVPGNYTSAQIQEQLKRQHHKCYYCHSQFKKTDEQYVFQIDHTFPVTREYASNDISHLVLTCPACNRKKGNKYPWERPEGGRLL